MTKKEHRNGIGSSRKILVVALLAAFGPAHAADENVAALTNPLSGGSAGRLSSASGGRDSIIRCRSSISSLSLSRWRSNRNCCS